MMTMDYEGVFLYGWWFEGEGDDWFWL